MVDFQLKFHKTIGMVASGNKFSGKSFIFKWFVRKYFLNRYFVYDPTPEQEWSKAGFQNVFVPKTGTIEEFEAVCGKVLKLGNLMFIIEEAQDVMPGGPGSKLGPNTLKLIMHGRHNGIGFMATTKRPALLNTTVRSEANYVFLFRHSIPNDLEYLEKSVGVDAWILERLQNYNFMVQDSTGGIHTSQFFGPYMLVGDKILQIEDDKLKRDNAFAIILGEECYKWLRTNGVKGVITRPNVDVWIRSKGLDLLPGVSEAVYTYVNTKSKIR